jgi:hypothetical protein
MRIKLLIIILLCFSLTAFSQKIAVVIAIDGFQYNHIEKLWSKFDNGGFKRAVTLGYSADNVQCGYASKDFLPDYTAIYCGSTPSENGIVGNKIFSALDENLISIVEDGRYNGIGTAIGRSAKNLNTLTLTDVLKSTSPQSKAVSIGLTPEATIAAAGHNADVAVWIDDEAFIATSDYYKRLPIWASTMNTAGIIRNFIKAKWNPSLSLTAYKFKPENISSDNYFYVPNSNTSKELVENFRRTPAANSVIRDLALNAITDEQLGKDNNIDILCLNFNTLPIGNNSAELASAEKEDMYINLDKDLKILFQSIETNIGFDNALIIIVGTQAEQYSHNTLKNSNLETGIFDGRRSMALLNTFLMQKYGQGRWVINYSSGQIFINHALVEKNDIDIEKMKYDIVAFVSTLQGVKNCYSSTDILRASGDENDVMVRLRKSFYPNRSGDVAIVLQNGWQDVDINSKEQVISSVSTKYVPLIIFGLNIPSQRTNANLKIIDIAPTICDLINISYPMDCEGNKFNVRKK